MPRRYLICPLKNAAPQRWGAAFSLCKAFLVAFAVLLFDISDHLLALCNFVTLWDAFKAIALEGKPDDWHNDDHGYGQIEHLLIGRKEAGDRQDNAKDNGNDRIDLGKSAKIERTFFFPFRTALSQKTSCDRHDHGNVQEDRTGDREHKIVRSVNRTEQCQSGGRPDRIRGRAVLGAH